MNYNDKVTLRLKENHQNKDGEKSERQIRRQNKRNYDKFIDKAYKYFNKEWLDSVDENIKMNLSQDWLMTSYRNKYSINPVEFGDWIKSSFKNVKPNVSVYRNIIINNILNEVDPDN